MEYDSRKAKRRKIMGIVNCTPDSFYTGAGHLPTEQELEQVISDHLHGGVDLLDVGGCSTRPFADEVPIEEEWQRVRFGLQTAERVCRERGANPTLSVDTFHSEVARRAIEEFGVGMINDVSGGVYDKRMYDVIAQSGVQYVAMHMRGTPQTMMTMTHYDDVVQEVADALLERVDRMHEAGIQDRQIILDPGFGFAKTRVQEYRLLDGLDRIAALGFPLLVGVSRKSMVSKVLQVDAASALPATTALHWELLRKGAEILRVHDVREARQVLQLYDFYEQVLYT